MTEQEARRLRVGDRVSYCNLVMGTVTRLLRSGIVVDWDDGQNECGIDFEDAARIRKEAGM